MGYLPLRTSVPSPMLTDIPSLGMDAASLAADFRRHFTHTLGRNRHCMAAHYYYESLALALRDRLMERWKNTQYAYEEADSRFVYYLSMEFLMGRTLGNAVLNLGLANETNQALSSLGLILEEMAESEHDAGLGNGGLGRLAACFLDSCATLQLPVMGYGIRYIYGMFRQRIENGHQIEEPDHWMRGGNPWEVERPEFTQRIRFGGRSGVARDNDGRLRGYWLDTQDVLAVPYDIPIPGYRNGTVNTLRLWSALATDEFDLTEFNAGSYTESVRDKNAAEHITMVLYPNDTSENGKELRLRQQYFLASASLQDVLRQWVNWHGRDFSEFAARNCFQLNDTHPSCAIPELMRLLLDDYGLGWDEAWAITTRTMAYTNHTLLPEALERWPVRMFRQLLPRLLDIIFEINARFLTQVARRWPGDTIRQWRMSLIEEGADPMVRMAYLAIVGSFSVNGVAELHSRLLAQGLLRDFYDLWPEKFNNKTNGVTQRRWLAGCNPNLAELITSAIGEDWISDLDHLSRLAPLVDNADFRARWRMVRRIGKMRLAKLIQVECRVWFDPETLFDVQVKRIHEYKRQLLNCLHIIHLYDRVKRGDTADWTSRCVLFGGKAAPGYRLAKRIIKLINNVAAVINGDPEVGNLLRVAFLPDYRVSAMEVICPGTDLSEQISTAGKEASGTGNMKFMMNGAITIGTLDGANIEIRDAVGAENFFLFGLNAEEVEIKRRDYNPDATIAADEDLFRVMRLLESGHFSQFEPGIFDGITESLRSPYDPWMTIADFRSFVDTQRRAAATYRNQDLWTRMSIFNTAASGRFSTDRTILDYNREIWRLTPIAAIK
ncbi:Alpha-1,4 glucan phosphorylase [Gammaproteobacteria bacterium]